MHPVGNTTNTEITTNGFNFTYDDIQLNIFSYLPLRDLYSVSLTQRQWAALVSSEQGNFVLWTPLLQRYFPLAYERAQDTGSKNFKEIYKDRHVHELHIRKGEFTEQALYLDQRIRCFFFKGNRFWTVSAEGDVNVLNPRGEVSTFRVGINTSRSSTPLAVNDDHLFIATEAGKIYVLNDRGKLVKEIILEEGGQDPISFLQVHDQVLSAGSQSGTVKLWNHDGKLLQKIPQPEGKSVCALYLDNQYTVVGFEHGVVKVWNHENKLIATIPQEGNIACRDIRVKDHRLFIQTQDSIQIWDYKRFQLKTLFLPNHCFAVNGNYLAVVLPCSFISGKHNTEIWNIDTEKRIQVVIGKGDNPMGVDMDDHRIFLVCPHTIKIYDWRFPPFSLCSKEELETHFKILDLLTQRFITDQRLDGNLLHELLDKVHPDLKNCLQQHIMKVSISVEDPSIKEKEILRRTHIELYWELLLVCFYKKDEEKKLEVISQLLDQLSQLYSYPRSQKEYVIRDSRKTLLTISSGTDGQRTINSLKREFKKFVWEEDLPLILWDLRVYTPEQYSNLPKVGLRSSSDFQALGITSFEQLKLALQEEKNSADSRAALQGCRARRDKAINRLENLLEIASEMQQKYPLILPIEGQHVDLWTCIGKDIQTYQNNLREKSNTDTKVRDAFSQEGYEKIVVEINGWIDYVAVTKLRTYLLQQDLALFWQKLNKRGINTLAGFLGLNPEISPFELAKSNPFKWLEYNVDG